MIPGTAKLLRLTAMAAALLLCGLRAGAVVPEPDERLAAYEAAIASANPVAALAFLKDGEVRELAAANPAKNAALLGKAEALKDLRDLLALPWDNNKVNLLNQSLKIRIDVDRPLVKMGIGPAPEKLLSWIGKYQPAYPARKTEVVKKAIRQWEVIFGTMTDTRQMSWGQADMFSHRGVTVRKAAWEAMVIRERNAVIENIIEQDSDFLIYNDQRLNAGKDQVAVSMAVQQVIAAGGLTQEQKDQLMGKTLEDKLYLLGNMFDNSVITASPELKARIDSARSSLPQEILPAQQRRLLGDMLNTAVSKELAGTQAGTTALSAFSGGLKIAVAPVGGGYSRYDAASGSIVLDSETIQQYMRIKGYTASSLMSSPAQVAEIAKYMSPMVVYEAAHKLQADWAAQKGVYLPQTQENEIEAMSLEGLYTTEKMKKDADFKNILTSSRDFSSYASKRMDIGTEFELSGSKKFATTVRQRYFPGLPSLDAAASQVLGAVTEELERRSTMPAADKTAIDAAGLNLQETLEMSPQELAGSVGEIQTSVLAKIQGDLVNLGVYRSRYSASERLGRKALKALEAGTAPKTSATPVLI